MAEIVVFGAAGKLGTRVIAEAANRGGHQITAVVSDTPPAQQWPAVVRVTVGDAADRKSAAELAAGADVLISVVGGPDKSIYLRVAQNLVETLAAIGSGAPRVLHSGGGGSLLSADGKRYVDQPGFPKAARPDSLGQAAALDFYRTSKGAIWTYLSPPPGNFAPGERRGTYRIGTDYPVFDAIGGFGISYEDYAVALVDEIENSRFVNTRFTVGY
jgi:putative NADH-flavin reductase